MFPVCRHGRHIGGRTFVEDDERQPFELALTRRAGPEHDGALLAVDDDGDGTRPQLTPALASRVKHRAELDAQLLENQLEDADGRRAARVLKEPSRVLRQMDDVVVLIDDEARRRIRFQHP